MEGAESMIGAKVPREGTAKSAEAKWGCEEWVRSPQEGASGKVEMAVVSASGRVEMWAADRVVKGLCSRSTQEHNDGMV